VKTATIRLFSPVGVGLLLQFAEEIQAAKELYGSHAYALEIHCAIVRMLVGCSSDTTAFGELLQFHGLFIKARKSPFPLNLVVITADSGVDMQSFILENVPKDLPNTYLVSKVEE